MDSVGMEKTLDGKRYKRSEHGFRLGSVLDNEGESPGRALSAAPLFQKTDPLLKFGFAEAGYLGIMDGMPVLQLKEVSFAYPNCGAPVLSKVSLSVSASSRLA